MSVTGRGFQSAVGVGVSLTFLHTSKKTQTSHPSFLYHILFASQVDHGFGFVQQAEGKLEEWRAVAGAI